MSEDVYGMLEDLSKQMDEWSSFPKNLLVGYVFKDLVTVVLDQAGYEVYPYGYESFLPAIKRKLYDREIRSSPILERVRFTPDILVYDRDGKFVQLVEVKSRATTFNGKYDIKEVGRYRKYWPESILVLVVPQEPYLCAQRVSDLPHGETSFDHACDFVPIESVFTRINWEAKRPFSRRLCVKLTTRLFAAFTWEGRIT